MDSDFKDIKLIEPRIEGGMPLFQAIHNRKSSKSYTPNKELSLQQISEILYCAYGFNDPKTEHRTVSSGMTAFPLQIYIVLPKGIYHYEPKENILKALKKGDYMEKTGRQNFVKDASMTLIFYSNTDIKLDNEMKAKYYEGTPKEERNQWADIEVGFACQNIYLYCTSENLKTCVRAWCDGEFFKKELGLPDNYRFVLADSIGI